MNFRMQSISVVAVLITTLGFTQVVLSQGILEEIIVTAQKREQSLQDVPISVSALSGDYVDNAVIDNFEVLMQMVPSVSVVASLSGDSLAIRGISSGVNPGFEQSVGTFIDGVYYGQSSTSRARFFDMERLEILRGPQSTYFGNNTIAGAMSITSRKPGDEFEASIKGTYGPDDEDYGLEGVISGPVTDTLKLRAGIKWSGYDGFLNNTFKNRSEPNEDTIGGRVTAVWTPTDNFDATFKAEYSQFKQEGRAIETIDCPPPASLQPVGGPPFVRQFGVSCSILIGAVQPIGIPPFVAGLLNSFAEPTFDNAVDGNVQRGGPGNGNIGGFTAIDDDYSVDTRTYVLTMNYDINEHTLTSVSAYAGFRERLYTDVDNVPTAMVQVAEPEDYDQYSQELRITSPSGGEFEYIAGVYYQTEDIKTNQSIVAGMPIATPPILAAGLTGRVHQFIPYDQDTETFAVFGALTWNITDALRTTFGLRFTNVDKEATRTVKLFDPTFFLVPELAPFTPALDNNPQTQTTNIPLTNYSRSDDDLNPSFNIQYDVTEDDMVYFSFAQGFKSGGIDAQSVFGDVERINFNPEEVDAYEIGAKTAWLDGDLQANVSLFRSEYTDLQVSIFSGTGTTFFVDNAASAISQGIEVDLRWAATERLTLSTAFSYLDSTYDSFPNGPCHFPLQVSGLTSCQAPPVGTNSADLEGERLTYAPEWSGNFIANYIYPLANGMEISSNLSVQFSTEYSTRADNDPRSFQDKTYAKVDIRVGLSTDRWELAVLGRNIFDEEVSNLGNRLVASNGSMWKQFERPAHVLVTAEYRW